MNISPNFQVTKKSLICTLLFILFAGFFTTAAAQNYLTSIIIYPHNPTMGIGQSLVFTAEGRDQYGNIMAIPNPTWEGDGTNGTITPNGQQCTYLATKQGNGYIICWSGPSGSNKHGSTDITIVKALDFGDAPDPTYNTLIQNNGAFHIIDFNVYLGAEVDADPDGQPQAQALGDDNDGDDDEDGIQFKTKLFPGAPAVIDVTASVDGYLNGFLDFAANGHWGDVDDRIFLNQALSAGENTLIFFVPSTASTGKSFARFRFTSFSSEGGLCYGGLAENGEVEDYEVEISEIPENGLDFGDAPDSPYNTLAANYGAQHVIDPEIYLGLKIDGEPDGQPESHALGDDKNGDDDEDGIIFIDPIIPGKTTRIEVTASADGFLNGWIDFENNGDWDSEDDRIFTAQPLKAGINRFEFLVPEAAVIGKTFARFRYLTILGTVCYSGLVHNGEVEDYEVTILDASHGFDFGDAPDPTYPTLLATNGARHIINPEIFIGNLIDAESDGLSEIHAAGDDINGSNDEDGVVFTAPLFAGFPAAVTVTASTAGYLNFWLDLNGDGDWIDENEQVFKDQELTSGTNELPFNIPLLASADTTFARFRFSTMKDLNVTGWAENGEVEDYLVLIEKIPDELEYGDAPDPTYPTLLANDGARHIPWGRSVFLGSKVDMEPDGQPEPHALGDDNDGNNDDDGVAFVDFLIPDTTTTIEVTASAGGFLNAWIDFDANGDWDGANDQIFSAQQLTAGKNTLSFAVPATAAFGNTFARFRFNNRDSTMKYHGMVIGGEVEDYEITIIDASHGYDFGDAPDPTYPTLAGTNGARHIIDPKILLGVLIDAENNGLQETSALGDDNNNSDDEDGIVFQTPLFAGDSSRFTVTASAAGYLNFWLDLNGDGDWTDGDEQLFVDKPVVSGANDFAINIPSSATADTTFARFRFSTALGLNSTGLAINGEVEDYQVVLIQVPDELDYGDAPDPSYPTLKASNGARHIPNTNVYLGSKFDVESDGLAHANALGDDNNPAVGGNDEDGVKITSPIIAGGTTYLTVVTSTVGYLNGWIDFDGDGNWEGTDEQIFTDKQLETGLNGLSFPVSASANIGNSFARFRFSTTDGLSYIGLAIDGEVEDYQVTIEEERIREVKWSQPALKNPDSDYPNSYWGWGEHSTFIREEESDTTCFVADDWFCYDHRPVTAIRWWGSYADWDTTVAPDDGPWGFQIGLWTDVPVSENDPFSHSGKMIRQWEVSRYSVHERFVGSDYIPTRMAKRDTCFQYDYSLPYSDWFEQDDDSSVYWLSISAIYDTIPDFHVWGWKTRDRYFNDDAVRIFKPSHPAVDSVYRIGEPVELGWDMSFELLTNELGEGYDFGDAPDPDYPTLHLSNGAEHFPLPGQYLGSTIDLEFDGLPNGNASGDDNEPAVGGTDDEDGVNFTSQIAPGDTAFLTVSASVDGYLNTWIDFDMNGTWDDAEDQVFFDLPLSAGSNYLQFFVPANVTTNSAIARFRFCTTSGFTYKGLVIGGEVEDYLLSIYTGVKEETSQLPTQFKLYQNFPNPFNPNTEIGYQLPKSEYVRLSIYNISGQEIRVLVDEIKSIGSHKVTWDGKDGRGNNVPAGLYLYRIKANTVVDSKKLLLIK